MTTAAITATATATAAVIKRPRWRPSFEEGASDDGANGSLGLPASPREADGIAPEQFPPIAVLLLMTGLTQVLSLERVLGVTAGHDATAEFVQSVIDRLEP